MAQHSGRRGENVIAPLFCGDALTLLDSQGCLQMMAAPELCLCLQLQAEEFSIQWSLCSQLTRKRNIKAGSGAA